MSQHILLVDDDRNELTVFTNALKLVSPGDAFRCAYADSAERALNMLRYTVPHFIFMDMNMTMINGLMFLNLIKKEPRMRHTQVYLYSENITNMVYEKAKLFRAAGCIAKTGSASELAERLKSIFVSAMMPSYVFSANVNYLYPHSGSEIQVSNWPPFPKGVF
jgi:CheY-like chemotaxis protein